MARFTVQTRRKGGRRLKLAPRGHLKTSLWTIIDTIQQICIDPNLQFLLVADTGMNAVQFMKEIQLHFERNELFRVVMHHVIPENLNGVVWNQYQMEVKRSAISRGPTVDAIGALGGSESRHYHRIKADDLVTEKCIRSDVEMDKVIHWAGGLESLLVTPNDDCIDFIGSRKKKGDLYEAQEKYYGEGYEEQPIGPNATQKGDLLIYSISAENEKGEVIFPEVISKKFLNRLRKYDPERYHAQYGNSPKAEGVNTFDMRHLRYFRWTPEGRILCIHNGEVELEISPWELDRILLYDPSVAEKRRSSKNAMHVVGKGSHPFRIVLESRIGHYLPNEAVDNLFELDMKWKPSIISIERRGFQGWVKYWLEERAEKDGLPYLPVVEWPPEGASEAQWMKIEHIRGLQPIVRAGCLWVHEDNKELIDELEFYPNVRWDDGLDALGQGHTYWPMSMDELDLKKSKKKEMDYLEAHVLGIEIGNRDAREERIFNEEEFLRQLGPGGYTLLRNPQ
jgi:hypothetical protein